MKLLKGLLLGAALSAAVVLAGRAALRAKDSAKSADRNVRDIADEPSPYIAVVEETLKNIESEASSMRQAFEDALEEEHRHEKALARDTGLRI